MAMNWVDQGGYLTNQKLSMDFRETAQPLIRFRQFVDVKESFGKTSGQTVNWLKVANTTNYGKSVPETNTMPETDQSLTWGTLTVGEYGNSIPHTFKVEALSEFDIKDIIRKGLRNDNVKVLDGVVERQFNATKLRYVGTSTTAATVTVDGVATATNTSILNSYHVRKMRLELETRNVPTWDGGDYAGILSLEAAESLEGALETLNSYTEAGYKKILAGEIGRMHGVRFVKDGFASRFVFDADAGTATAISWSGGESGVGYMCGQETVMEAIAVPDEIRLKVVTDYGRSKGIAWYFLGNWKIMWDTDADSRIIKWDSNA